jgi:hypothetical protein
MAKILLAFGTHGRGDRPPDRRFFRSAVVPFIEEALREGRKVAVIHELCLYDRIGFLEEDVQRLLSGRGAEGAGEWLREDLAMVQAEANHALRNTLDLGIAGAPVADWGFNDAIMEVNAARPGSVLSIIEPQTVESLFAHWRMRSFLSSLGPQGVDCMAGFIRTMAEDCIRRDLGVLRLAERSALINGEAAIVIPRGSAHRGMAGLIRGRHELLVAEGRSREDYMDRAVRLSYGRSLGEDEARAFAALELELLRFVHRMAKGPACRAADMLGAGEWYRERLFRKGMREIDGMIAGGRFELPVPGL